MNLWNAKKTRSENECCACIIAHALQAFLAEICNINLLKIFKKVCNAMWLINIIRRFSGIKGVTCTCDFFLGSKFC